MQIRIIRKKKNRLTIQTIPIIIQIIATIILLKILPITITTTIMIGIALLIIITSSLEILKEIIKTITLTKKI